MTAGIGHNRGPELEGRGWRRHCWGEARRALLPHLPLEVVRRRVRRAAELGLDYRAYATVRASTGRDVIGFLFSTNALGLRRDGDPLPKAVARDVARIARAERIGLVAPGWRHPDAPEDGIDDWAEAPGPWAAWRAQAEALAQARGRLPADGVLLVGAAPWERGWTEAGGLAGYLPAAAYFGRG